MEREIAVIGAGAAGITAALLLSRAGHRVSLFEKESRLGGHTHTIVIADGEDAQTPVDTGFIVLNNQTYPMLHRLFETLGVRVRWSEMSFGYHSDESGLSYAGTSLNGVFAQRNNALSLSFWRMLLDIRRFSRDAQQALSRGELRDLTLGEYLGKRDYSTLMIEAYLLPMTAAIWSSPLDDVRSFPAEMLVRFYGNHGLLSLHNRPRWQTVVGGSHAYLLAFERVFRGEIVRRAAIRSIRRTTEGVVLRFDSGEERVFAAAVLAAHADESLRLLEDPSPDEQRLLGVWKYQRNLGVLHTDSSVLPSNRRAWASWNFRRGERSDRPVSLTYHMNRLQGLQTKNEYFVTLNPLRPIAGRQVIEQLEYAHPIYTLESLRLQPELKCLNGVRATYFCGSYFGYGFHEDAVRSGADAARLLGSEL